MSNIVQKRPDLVGYCEPRFTPLTGLFSGAAGTQPSGLAAPDAAESGKAMTSPAISRPTCPECRQPTGLFLEGASAQAWVNYYRCVICAHVWNIEKSTQHSQSNMSLGSTKPGFLRSLGRRE